MVLLSSGRCVCMQKAVRTQARMNFGRLAVVSPVWIHRLGEHGKMEITPSSVSRQHLKTKWGFGGTTWLRWDVPKGPLDSCSSQCHFSQGSGSTRGMQEGSSWRQLSLGNSWVLELIYSAAPYSLHKWMLLSTET